MEKNIMDKFQHIKTYAEFKEHNNNLKNTMILVFGYDEQAKIEELQYWAELLEDLMTLYPTYLKILLVNFLLT
jgi:Grx4 family monothiol glutaredoxin